MQLPKKRTIFNLYIRFFYRIGEFITNLPFRLLPERFSERAFVGQFSPTIKDRNIISKISVRKFQFDTQFVPGMLKTNELDVLLILSATVKVKGDVVELGSWLGKSTIYLAKGCSLSGNGKVYAIDTFKGNPGKEHIYKAPLKKGETIYSRFLKNINKTQFRNLIVPIKMPSKEAQKKLKDIRIKILFIDACHDYDAVCEDIMLWKNTLKLGGYIVLHDFAGEMEGCVRAIYEGVIKKPEFKPVFLLDSLFVAEKIRPS